MSVCSLCGTSQGPLYRYKDSKFEGIYCVECIGGYVLESMAIGEPVRLSPVEENNLRVKFNL